MSVQIKLHWRKFTTLAIFAAVIVISSSYIYVSAKVSDDFKVGERVEVSVTGLEGDGYYELCVITEVLNTGYRVVCGGTEYFVQRGWVRRPKGNIKPPAKNANRAVPKDDDAPVKQNDDANDDEEIQTADGNCDFDPPGAKVSNTDKFSAALAKRILYNRYLMFANGTLSAPLKVGVTFLSFQVGKSFTNIARGGFRINDAAPVNATIYQVKSKHIVCEQYRDSTQRKQIESNFACFKNKDGEWVCGIDGFPKIIQLK
ncbi:MAG: hypothetical protein M3Q33_09270 [Acidobacteriota bacterium]|nr:hypothetical protein [Acidobacteriota bacterium]